MKTTFHPTLQSSAFVHKSLFLILKMQLQMVQQTCKWLEIYLIDTKQEIVFVKIHLVNVVVAISWQ